MKIIIEIPKSGRSSCKKCKKKITEKEIRVQRYNAFNGASFYHLNCFDIVEEFRNIIICRELENNQDVQQKVIEWKSKFSSKFIKKRKGPATDEILQSVKKRKQNIDDPFLKSLPSEIWCIVISFLPFRDVIHRFGLICKSSFELTHDDKVWIPRCLFEKENENESYMSFFIKEHLEYCESCNDHCGDEYYLSCTDSVVCNKCRKNNPKYAMVTSSQAKVNYKLSDEDLKSLKDTTEFNHHNKKIPLIKYLQIDCEKLEKKNRKESIEDEVKRLGGDIKKIDFDNIIAREYIDKVTSKKSVTIAKELMKLSNQTFGK